MIRLPSTFRPYDVYFSGDPALKQSPDAPKADASEDDIKAYVEAKKQYLATFFACHDTGDWSPLLIEGQTPLKFVMLHVDRTTFRALVDRIGLPESNPRHIGERLAQSLFVRLALSSIVGAEGLVVRRESDPQWDGWVMAQPEVIQVLDAADPRIVSELGLMVQRKATLSGKS